MLRIACCLTNEVAGGKSSGLGWLSKRKGGAGAMGNTREPGDGAGDRGGRAAVRPATHLSPNRQTQAPAPNIITLTKSQIKGRERIGRLKILHPHA